MPDYPRCVLVDDDADFLALARVYLARECPHLEVVTFGDGAPAFDFLARYSVDVLITDYRMPELDGLRLTRRVRACARDILIVVMSADNVEAQALVAGADAFVPKHDFALRIGAIVERGLAAR